MFKVSGIDSDGNVLGYPANSFVKYNLPIQNIEKNLTKVRIKKHPNLF